MSQEQDLINDKLNLAVLYFKSKEFTKALKQYDDLYKDLTRYTVSQLRDIRRNDFNLSEESLMGPTIHPKLPSVLDQRAATYEKLNNLENSLKDANRLIKYEPISCKGYLRAGKILLLQNKDVIAYKTYQKGIYIIEKAIDKYKIEVPLRLWTNLKTQYSNLNKELKSIRKSQTKNEVNVEKETSSSSSMTSRPSLDHKTTRPILDRRPTRPSLDQKTKHSLRSSTSNIGSSSGLQARLDDMLPLKRSSSSTKSLPNFLPSSSSSPDFAAEQYDSNYQASTEEPSHKKQKRSKDPFEILPLEIIDLIFSQLSLKFIIQCHLVSRSWYNKLTHIPTLYNKRIFFKHRITSNEYMEGLRLIKRIISRTSSREIKALKLRSTVNQIHLNKIIENLVSDKDMKLKNLDIINKYFNIETFINKLSKVNWNNANISELTSLRLGIDSSLRYENVLLNLMKNLKTLEVVILDSSLSRGHSSLVPTSTKFQNLSITDPGIYESLENLTLINHPKLNKDAMAINANSTTFDPYAPLLSKRFPNLTNLTIVSYDFNDKETQFGKFLQNSPHLKMLYLENNDEISIKSFMMILSVYKPKFELNKLIIREKIVSNAINLSEFDMMDFAPLYELSYLDIYSSSLSVRGLTKMLTIANTSCKLKTLFIGNSNYIYFKNDKFTASSKISLSHILLLVPNLENLYLNEIELDNSSMKFFYSEIMNLIGLSNCKLKLLDLSFCTAIDGTGLMNLFHIPYYNNTNLNLNHVFKLDELHLDGIDLNKETLKVIQKKGYVKTIKNDQFKSKWRQYGVNSLVPDITR